ncbi:hypothetical protein K525DRAFT_273980 [Schizophyllum commune Loenen D]|nr:hypothetical protein K525DRAFT_273980 [Schizophyllum commune Loenen D]
MSAEAPPGNTDQRLRLERNDILFERASTIASRDILRTGPFPSIGEAAPFRDMEVSLAAESERIGAEMRRLTALHDEALSQLQVVRSMLSPIRRLPRELLSEIFLENLLHYDYPRKMNAARILASVCATWRVTARAMSALWVHVDYTRCSLENLQPLLDMHAELAAPLSLRLYSTIDRPDRVQRLLSLPPQCTTRWGQVSLFLKKNTFDRELEPDLSSLQRLDAHLRGSTHPERALFMVLSRAPALRTLSLHMLYDRYYGDWQELRSPCLPHLTELTLSSRGALTNMAFFPILAQCAGTLERLTLVSEPAWSDANIPTRPIILPHLHTLDLQYTAHKYLFHFDTPALTSLATRDSCGTHAGALHSLHHLLTTSTTLPPITTLLLHRVGAPDPEDFLQCLELLPSLTALHIARAPDDGVPWHVLVRLACTDFRAPLVPRLTAFSLRYARGRVPEKLRRALRVMLRSRAGRKVLRGVDVEALQSVETDLDADAASEEDTRGDGV